MITSHYITYVKAPDKKALPDMLKDMKAISQALPEANIDFQKDFLDKLYGFSKSPKRFPVDKVSIREDKVERDFICSLILCYSFHTGNSTIVTTNLPKADWEKAIGVYHWVTDRKYSEDLVFFN